jgi:outer membrane protein assembly factor BamB/predicted Zn-dependent protease
LGGQEDAGPEVPPDLRADATYTDVYVNDSLAAADSIGRARALAERGRWSEAAALLQETIETSGGQLVRLAPGRYVGIRDHVSSVIAGWPRAGIAAYRQLYERDAEAAIAALATSRAVPELLSVFHRYFCTAAAARLADTLGQLAIESGDLAQADQLYARVLERHPDRALFAAPYGAMRAVIAAMRGDRSAHRAVAQAESAAVVRWMGQERRLSDVLAEVGDRFAALHAPASVHSWPIFSGNTERSRGASTRVDELGLLWQSDALASQGDDRDGEQDDVTLAGLQERARNLSVYPVVDGGLVFVQRFRELIAIHRNTGATAWRFRADEFSAPTYAYLEEQPPPWDAPTVHDGRIYAALPGEAISYYSYESPRSPPELVCLDAVTGQMIWRIDPESFEEAFAEILFDSTPMIRHQRMYIVGRRRRSFGFEDCYLYRFSASTGALEQRTHLGSASTGTFGSRQATKAIPALHGDTVYVCTNLGSVAAVAAHTGAVRWLTLYERRRQSEDGGEDWADRRARAWHFNPVIWSDGRLLVLPTDARNVMILDAGDGTILQSIPVAELGRMTTVFGLRGDTVCGVGSEAACYDLAARRPLWSTPLPADARVHGRGVWVDDRLLVPATSRLLTFAVEDGTRTEVRWRSEGEGGNLLALPDQLLVAESNHLCAYVRRTQIFESLRQRMAAAPSDPLPALEMAEIALSNDEYADAVSALEEAVQRADSQQTPPESPVVRRLFEDVLVFVERLSSRDALDDDLADRLFRNASRFAPDPPAHLVYRIRFAELFEQRGSASRAVRLYQQILRDRTLRALPARRDAPDSESAGALAQSRIAALIEEHGRAVYAGFDEEAGRWLQSGRSAGDTEALDRLVSTFPNSESAPVALVALGDLLAAGGDAERAAKRYAAAYHRYPDRVDRPKVLKKIADAYEQAGEASTAYRWLTKAAREHPGVRFEAEGGRLIGFLDYRERLAQVRNQVEPSRARIELPLASRFTKRFEEDILLLLPRFGDLPGSSWARFFVRGPAGIDAFDSKTGSRAWSETANVAGRAELLAVTPDVAVVATSHEILGLDAATGARRWSYGEPAAHLEDPDADWEDEPAHRAFSILGDRLVSVRGDGHFQCVSMATGQEIWARTHRPLPAGALRLSDAWVVYTGVHDGHVTLNLIDAADGTWVDTIATDERRAVEDVLVTLDDQIVLVTSQSVVSYDPITRRRRWRVAPAGHIRPASLLLDLDAIHFSPDGRYLQKVSLDDGRLLWESERLVRSADDEWVVEREGSTIVVSSTSFVTAIDTVTGLTLWKGATPEAPRFIARFLTPRYVIAVDVPGPLREADSIAYFYEHRHASGLIPRDGGAPNLGRIADVRAVLAVDGALLIQTGSTIEGWASP